MKKVILFNPRSANYKPRIPNSIFSIASSIEGIREYVMVDGNLEVDPWDKILKITCNPAVLDISALLRCQGHN